MKKRERNKMTIATDPSHSGKTQPARQPAAQPERYEHLVAAIAMLLETARGASVRAINSIMTAACWEIWHRIVEFEQKGEKRAEYGAVVIERLSADLTARFGRGFSPVNLSQMKKFYLLWPKPQIFQTPSEKSGALPAASVNLPIPQTPSEEFPLPRTAAYFPLPWR